MIDRAYRDSASHRLNSKWQHNPFPGLLQGEALSDDNNMSDSINDTAQRIRMRRQEGVPKYVMLRNALAEEIACGRWGPGDKLPAEDVLATMTSLSLGTVQRSLRMLVEEGRLVRRHGNRTRRMVTLPRMSHNAMSIAPRT